MKAYKGLPTWDELTNEKYTGLQGPAACEPGVDSGGGSRWPRNLARWGRKALGPFVYVWNSFFFLFFAIFAIIREEDRLSNIVSAVFFAAMLGALVAFDHHVRRAIRREEEQLDKMTDLLNKEFNKADV